MIAAMPRVNPSITGHGMNVTARPRPTTPATSTIRPDMMVTIAMLPIPCSATIGARITAIAPVGPDTWTCDPPKTAATSPATTAVMSPAAAPTPDEMPNASASGNATTPTVTPARTSARQLVRNWL